MWGDGFLSVEECAQQMAITVEQVAQLVKRDILRADRDGLVQPAIISGAVE